MTKHVPTDRELEALKVLWHRNEATVKDVWEAMSETAGEIAYTTVLSLLQVMEKKGLVGHRRVGKAYVYFAKVQRASTFRTLAAGFLDKVFDGALDEYVAHAIESRNLTHEELDRLEQAVAEAKKRVRLPDKGGKR